MIVWLVPAVLSIAASAPHTAGVEVPTVACPSDGQQGPQPAPARRGPAVRLPAAAAAHLAFYESRELGVLAPRGWNCLEISGSNGAVLIVTPSRHSFADLHDLRGPAIQLGLSYGGTSGRFAVAEAISRLFPDAMAFARQVEAEGILDRPLPTRPFPHDTLERVTAHVVKFTTPPRQRGLGTIGRLVADTEPIEGAVILLDDEEEPNLVQIDVRLARGDAIWSTVIIDAVVGTQDSATRFHR